MRKNRPGRPTRFDKEVIRLLRDESNYSFQEIADKLGIKSRQLARHHYLKTYEKGRQKNNS